MPKLERWIIVSKMIPVLEKETISEIISLGGQIGGGFSQIHQHIEVNPANKERIEELLKEKGFDVANSSEAAICHPECLKTGR